ncbi:hypothetical protein [Thalassospira xiamenensis]|uniref:hypothetical protein n=1 Tax=Thalassospira xiamenensis TaxID=220697 RepID=UPI001BAFDB3D|nr:hypothetical protein [Thalassospira xiamenensis]
MDIDVESIIRAAKLGRSRKDAQVDTCSAFAAALYDVLMRNGVEAQVITASATWAHGAQSWAHSLVKVGSKYYDSLGEFSEEIWRKRNRIHATVESDVRYSAEPREDCFDEEHSDFHASYYKALESSISLNPDHHGMAL